MIDNSIYKVIIIKGIINEFTIVLLVFELDK